MHQKQQTKKLLKGKTTGKQKKSVSKRMTRDEEKAMERQKMNQTKLLYQQEFVKMILDYQLQEHERFLYEFNVNFKQFDSDNDGILTED